MTHDHAPGESCTGRAAAAFVDMRLAHFSMLAAVERHRQARLAVERNPTLSTLEAVDESAADLVRAMEIARCALMRYGFASGLLEPAGCIGHEDGSDRSHGAESGNPPA